MTGSSWACAKATASQTFWKMVRREANRITTERRRIACGQIVQNLEKGNALHQLHGIEDSTIFVHAELVDWNDAGMFKASRDARFANEALLIPGIARVEKDLEGDGPPQRILNRGQHFAHAAASDFRRGLIAATR